MILVDLELKMLADQHGHLCPNLAIGWRVGLLARRYIANNGAITAECLSCALDALRAMGPWKIKVDPIKGRHLYRLLPDRGQLLVLEVPLDFAWPGEDLINLEERLSRCEATPEEMAAYQVLIDKQVSRILTASDADLFACEKLNDLSGSGR